MRDVARNAVSPAAGPRAVAAAIPEPVLGPLELLRQEAGLVSIEPLFAETTSAAPESSPAAMHRSLAASATAAPRRSLQGFQLLKLRSKAVPAAVIRRLRASGAVELVELVPNRWPSAFDPRKRDQWGLRAINWVGHEHPDAAAVHVAVLDTGVDRRHPDLKDAIEIYRHDRSAARDYQGPDTHVSGIIAGVMNNAIGIAGVANCRLHCWKVFNDPTRRNEEGEFSMSDYGKAISAAIDSEIKVVNMSIGGVERSRSEAAAIRELRAAGVVVVTAMGNEFEDEDNPIEYPAAYKGSLAVGAVDKAGKRASFSCTGKHIGLVAPGTSILSTLPRVLSQFSNRREYGRGDGTSMATPFVAGAAALLYAALPKSRASATKIVSRLKSTAQKLPAMRGRKFTQDYGAGLLDLAKALS